MIEKNLRNKFRKSKTSNVYDRLTKMLDNLSTKSTSPYDEIKQSVFKELSVWSINYKETPEFVLEILNTVDYILDLYKSIAIKIAKIKMELSGKELQDKLNEIYDDLFLTGFGLDDEEIDFIEEEAKSLLKIYKTKDYANVAFEVADVIARGTHYLNKKEHKSTNWSLIVADQKKNIKSVVQKPDKTVESISNLINKTVKEKLNEVDMEFGRDLNGKIRVYGKKSDGSYQKIDPAEAPENFKVAKAAFDKLKKENRLGKINMYDTQTPDIESKPGLKFVVNYDKPDPATGKTSEPLKL